MPSTLDIETFIDEAGFTPFQAVVLLLCFLVMFMDGFDLAAVAYIVPSLMDDWGLTKPQLGQALSAAPFGLAFGALIAGALADRRGRKPALVGSVLLFGLGSVATAWTFSLGSLTIARFVTGVGLGAALPNTITLLSEYCPAPRQAMLVSAMLCGVPLGAGAGGLFAGWMIPAYGWHSLMLLGGIAPLLLCVLLLAWMPESVHYMVLKRQDAGRIRRILHRIRPASLDHVQRFVLSEPAVAGRSSIRTILAHPLRWGTALLWLSCFMSMLVYYMMVNWMPLLLKEVGLTINQFAYISALFPLGGGVGSILIGWMVGRSEPNKVLAATYLAAGVLAYGVGTIVGHPGETVILGCLVFLMGFASGGGQSALASMSAGFYPTQCRATGVGSMYGVGRFGAIIGVLAGAELLRQQFSPGLIFSFLLLPTGLVCIALLVKFVLYRKSGLGVAIDAAPGR